MSLIEHHSYKRSSVRSTELLAVLITTLFCSLFTFAQKPECDFYPEYRNSFTPKLRAENPSLSLTNEQIVERYAAKLRSEGVSETEISRRTRLIVIDALDHHGWILTSQIGEPVVANFQISDSRWKASSRKPAYFSQLRDLARATLGFTAREIPRYA